MSNHNAAIRHKERVNFMNQKQKTYSALADLVTQKYQCLAKIHDLSRRQMASVTSGDIEGLLDILAVKQRLLADLQALDRDAKDFDLHDLDGESMPGEFREVISTMLTRCRAMLEEILHTETACAQILEQRKNEIGKQLAEFHDFVRARAAYQQRGGSTSELDLTS